PPLRRSQPDCRERLAGVRRHALAWKVLPLLIGQPIVNAAHLQRTFEVPAMTAQRALAQLANAGVLQEPTGRSRNRVLQQPECAACSTPTPPRCVGKADRPA